MKFIALSKYTMAMVACKVSLLLLALVGVWPLSPSQAAVANLVLLPNAVAKGAVCLDGSLPGYYYRKGSGSGANSWILHLEGGGWCYNEDDCVLRSKTVLGSSKYWKPNATFGGFLSDSQEVNPDFYNWNIAFINYCDGASFAGNRETPLVWKGTTLYFRGFKVLQANLASILATGMDEAKEVILTGCSAGGLATYLHADFVQGVLPVRTEGIKFRAIADAGYFIDAPNITGDMHIRELYSYVFKMQNCTAGVNQACIKQLSQIGEPWMCFFAQYTFPFIYSPMFVLNSQYDTWQLGNIVQLNCTPPNCPSSEMVFFDAFRLEFLGAVDLTVQSPPTGLFLDSCLTHCQSLSDRSWANIKVKGQTARETFADWYFGRTGGTKEVDCAYPCNTSC